MNKLAPHLRCLLFSSTEPHLEQWWGAHATKHGWNGQASGRTDTNLDLRASLFKDPQGMSSLPLWTLPVCWLDSVFLPWTLSTQPGTWLPRLPGPTPQGCHQERRMVSPQSQFHGSPGRTLSGLVWQAVHLRVFSCDHVRKRSLPCEPPGWRQGGSISRKKREMLSREGEMLETGV